MKSEQDPKKLAIQLVGVTLLQVTADDQEGFMCFDTGAVVTTVNTHYFDLAEEHEEEAKIFDTKATTLPLTKGVIQELSCGAMHLREVPVRGIDMSYIEQPLRVASGTDLKFLGSIGMDLIGQRDFRLDLANGILQLDLTDLPNSKVTKLPLRRVDEFLVIQAEMEGTRGAFIVDTGASACMIDQSLTGHKPGELFSADFQIGDRHYADMPTVAADMSAFGVPEVVGIIGVPILVQQVVDIALSEQEMRLYA